MAQKIKYYKQDGTEYDFSKEPQIKIMQTSNADMNIGIPKNFTALEWFAKITAEIGYVSNDILEQAKQMEKEQINNAWASGVVSKNDMTAEQYYNKTYHNDDKLEDDDKDNGGAYVEEIYDKSSLLKQLDKLEMSLNGVSDMVDKLYDAIVVEENNSKTDNTWGKTINVNYVNK